MNFEVMFFDLDDTLYPFTSGVWNAVADKMNLYMVEVLGFNQAEVPVMREKLFRKYGTTLRGLRTEYNIDENDFLEYVHDIPLDQYLQPNKELANTLNLYSERKVIFTNASRKHAERVISVLGLEGVFDQIIDIIQISPWCKPFPEAFTKAFEIAGVGDPENCVFLDDSQRNLMAARQFGVYTIQVGSESRSDGADAAVLSLLDLPTVIPVESNILRVN